MSDKTFWDSRFAGDAYVFGTEPNAFLRAQAHRLTPGMEALALADGEGRNGVWLAGQGLHVTSTDFSSAAMAKARRLAGDRGVTLTMIAEDIAGRTWQAERFDLVAAIFIQFAGPVLRDAIFAGICRTLKPGGLLILQGYRPEQLAYGTGGPRQRENFYDRDLLLRAFGGLEILHLKSHDSTLQEGPGHDGLSALIDLVARKPAG